MVGEIMHVSMFDAIWRIPLVDIAQISVQRAIRRGVNVGSKSSDCAATWRKFKQSREGKS